MMPLISPKEHFEEQMSFLYQNGFRSINIKDLIGALYEGHSLPNNSIVITFDDGHLLLIKIAIPILNKYKLKSTMIIITDRVGKQNFVNWKQIRKVIQKGDSIESHSVTYRFLTEMDTDDVEKLD